MEVSVCRALLVCGAGRNNTAENVYCLLLWSSKMYTVCCCGAVKCILSAAVEQ
jgi:hypothetical protein